MPRHAVLFVPINQLTDPARKSRARPVAISNAHSSSVALIYRPGHTDPDVIHGMHIDSISPFLLTRNTESTSPASPDPYSALGPSNIRSTSSRLECFYLLGQCTMTIQRDFPPHISVLQVTTE
ncbi:hypothetical protein BDV18DRAFT_134986 [Aspergillus unguis]